MQCEYNVILRDVRATTDAVEKQYYIYRVCVCVCVVLDIQRELPKRHIVTCALSKSTIFFDIIS